MGIGTIFCGAGIVLFGLLSILAELTEQPIFTTIGSYLTVAGLAIGIVVLTYTTVKYNKGIF